MMSKQSLNAKIASKSKKNNRLPMSKTTRKHILVVEDHPDERELLTHILRRSGYNAKAAESGEGALTLLQKYRFDLVLADLNLPGMTGLELLSRVIQIDAS